MPVELTLFVVVVRLERVDVVDVQGRVVGRAVRAVRDFCQLTDINLAGFDLLFTNTPETTEIYFLEINYFFGRKGLGGSEGFYRILMEEIERWLEKKGLIATASRSR